jgi:Putative DNA-binding domain
MKLAQLQQNFIALIHNEANSIGTEVVEGGRIDVATRLHIYHHSYRARLLEVLQDVFEHTWSYLGDDTFADMAKRFIEAQPSTQRTLNRFGQGFPNYLAAQLPDDGEIAEIAQLDWLMRCAFDGPNCTPLTFTDLATITPEQWANIGFTFHPTLAMHALEHNAASIWDALKNNQTPPMVEKLSTSTVVTVWRRDLRPHFMTVDTMEAKAIALLQSGITFAAVCEKLQTDYSTIDVVPALGKAMHKWVDHEMLSAITGISA